MTDHFHRVNASSKTACGIALKTGERTFVDFDPDENKTDKDCLMHIEAGYLSAQSTPLVGRSGERIGMLNTHWKPSKYRPSERELRFLDLLARQAADLIEQRQTEEKLRRAAEMDAFRVELADVLRPLANPIEIQESVAQTAMKFFKADRCYYCETEDGKAIIRRDARREDLLSVAGEYPLENLPLFSLTMKSGRSLVVEDVRLTDLMDDELKRLCIEMQIISFINVPIIKDGEYKGNLCITNDAPRNWAKFEIELAEEIAERTWAAIERARTEEDLRESEELFRLVSDAVPSVIYDWNVEEDKITRSGELKNLLGFSADDPKTQTNKWWKSRLHPDDIEPAMEVIVEKLKSNEYRYEDEYRLKHRDGHYVWVRDIGVLLRDEAGKVTRWVGNVKDITQRKEYEELLRESEERLRIAVEAAEMATWIWDLKKDEIIWNEQHFLLLGMKPSKKRQHSETFLKHVHPDDQEWLSEKLSEAIKNNTTFEAEFRIIRQDTEEVRWMEGYGHVVEYADGNPIRMSGVMSDITLRKQSEAALRESEERFSKAFNASPLVLTISSLTTGKLIEVNQTFYNVTGYTREEVIGKTTLELGLWKNASERDAELEEVRQMGQLRNHEYVFRAKSGREIIGLLAAEKIEIGGEQFALTVIQDITLQKRVERKLRESEEDLRNLIESVTEYAIFTMTLDGVIDSWNTGAQNTFGFTEEEILGQSTKILFTPEDNEKNASEKEIQNALNHGRAADERFHLKSDGSRFYASGVLMPLVKNGEAAGFVKIARDLTAQITAEKNRRDMEMLQKLVKAQEDERRRIARDLHDELGQQLTGLRLKLEHLRKVSEQADISQEIDEIQSIAKGIDEGVDFIAWELRPAALDDLGLQAALKKYVKEWSEFSKIKAELSIIGRKKFDCCLK
jgi:PAS domain S-box-containing protein